MNARIFISDGVGEITSDLYLRSYRHSECALKDNQFGKFYLNETGEESRLFLMVCLADSRCKAFIGELFLSLECEQ